MFYVFYLTDQELTVYPQSTKSHSVEKFAWRDKELIKHFVEKLSYKDSVYLILDLIEEEIEFDWAPKVFPWERAGIVERRLNRLMGESTALAKVKYGIAQRKSENGRKEELVLSAKVENTFNLLAFLTQLEQANVLLKGIYSQPFLLKAYFENQFIALFKLPSGTESQPVLITSRLSEYRYRQTFVFEKNLRLSRLVEIDSSLNTNEEKQNALVKETQMAISYIYYQKILPFDSPMGLIFLDAEQQMLAGLEENCRNRKIIKPDWQAEDFVFSATTFNALMPNSRFCDPQAGLCFSEQLAVDYVMQAHPKGFYETDYLKRISALLAGKKAFFAVNSLLAIALTGFLVIQSTDVFLKWQEIGMLEERIQAHEVERSRLESLVRLKQDAQTIKSSVEFSEAILKLRLGKLAGFDIEPLTQAISAHSKHIQFINVEWQNRGRLDSKEYQITLEGWVFPFEGTFEKPVEWVDALVGDLEQVPGITNVQQSREPFNRKLNESTSIQTGDNPDKALPFTITLRVKNG